MHTSIDWNVSASWFGGWSGIEVSSNGADMLVLGDRGRIVFARMVREDGTLTGLDILHSSDLRSTVPMQVEAKTFDAEGLALGSDGTVHVSLEFDHRIERLDPATGTLDQRVSVPFDLTLNGGVEALAVDANGTLFALTEKKPPQEGPLNIYCYRGGVWDIYGRVPQRGPFLPVGADFDDTGRLWVLERAVTPLGFRSQIRMVDLNADPLSELTVLTTAPGQFDNLEGLSVWRDAAGALRVTAISDDNFLRIQRTQIVEFVIQE